MKGELPVLLRLLIALVKLVEGSARYIHRASTGFRAGLLTESLSDKERESFTIDAYDRTLPETRTDQGLHPWETSWFDRQLPKAPARILIAAAGNGREAIALCQQGYEVDVLEPADQPARRCRERLPDTSRVVQASFRDLTEAVLEQATTPAAELARNYDAVVIGWGGLNHVLQERDRDRLLRSCDQLTRGPVLASFFMDPHAVNNQRSKRSVSIGRSLGATIARIRGFEPEREPVEHTDWGGFIRHLRPEDIDKLAIATQRTIQWQREGDFPHASFIIPNEGSTMPDHD